MKVKNANEMLFSISDEIKSASISCRKDGFSCKKHLRKQVLFAGYGLQKKMFSAVLRMNSNSSKI